MHYIFAITIFAVGLSLCAGGIHTIRHASAFARTAARAAGTVTGFHERRGRTHGSAFGTGITGDISGGGWGGTSMPTRLYFPIVRFQTDDGREIETETMYGSSLRSVKIGDPVIVFFDPADPTCAALQGTQRSGRLLGAGMIAAGIGACTAALPALAFARTFTTSIGG